MVRDISGERFGRLVAIEPTDRRINGGIVWRCKCDCGNETFVARGNLISGGAKSCGCSKGMVIKDLAGIRFGSLVAIGPTERRCGGQIIWHCKCDCGNDAYVIRGNLIHGKTKSCGCGRNNDLSGKRFGKLIAIEPTEQRSEDAVVWRCRCDCGNETFASSRTLASGGKKSCGCLRKKKRNKKKDITGKRFGALVAEKETRLRGYVAYECVCDCGNHVTVRMVDLLSGKKTQCMPFDHSIIGEHFGKLLVKAYAGTDNGRGAVMRCECDCGNVCEIPARQLKRGNNLSCGCSEDDNRAANMRAHFDRVHVDGTNLDAISSNRLRPDNTSGVRGVAMTKSGRWRAYISFKREQRNLGTFDTLEEAADARKDAERELFHPVLKAHGIEPVEDDDA